MFAATTRLLLTLVFVVAAGGVGVSQDVTSNGPVRLVAGQQPGKGNYRVVQASGQDESQPRGLLDRLRSIGGGVSEEYDAGSKDLLEPPPADWSGVPYHKPKPAEISKDPQPMTDPTRTGSRPKRSGSVAVATRATPAASSPSTVPVPVGVGRVPTPPAEVRNPTQTSKSTATSASSEREPLSDASRPEFSSTYSSRRSNRRSVQPLSDVTASPSDRTAKGRGEATGSLHASTGDPVINVESDEAPATRDESPSPRVEQRPLPERRSITARDTTGNSGTSSRRTVESEEAIKKDARKTDNFVSGHSDSTGSAGLSMPTTTGSTSSAPTPPSLAAAPSSEPQQTSSPTESSTSVADSAAPTAEIGQLEQLQPVGSGIDKQRDRRRGASTSVAGGFQQRKAPSGDGVAKPVSADSGFRSEVPSVRVIAAGPSEITIRQKTPYEIRVENRGSLDAAGVLVRAQLPNWAAVREHAASAGDVTQKKQGNSQEWIWQIENLPAGASETLSLNLQAERSGSFDVNVDWTLLPRKEVLQVNVREPKLQLVIDGPDKVTYGESETYRVRVLNPGNGLAPNVIFTLSPNSATPQSQAIGDIPPGKEAEFEVELTAQDLGMLEIHGLATGDLALRTEEIKKIQIAAAKLEATLSGPPLKYQNGEATYELQVRNVGSAPSRDVVASLKLPAGLKYLGGLKGAQMTKDILTWRLDELAVDAVRDYQVRCQMVSTGTHRLAFHCKGSAAGEATVSIDTEVEALADLVLSVNDPPAPAPVGTEVTYEIVIRNRGSKAATDVKTLTHFGNNIEPIRVEGHVGEVSTGQVEFKSIDRIDPGQEVKLRVIAKADQEGLHRFRTEVSSADTVLVAEEATRYLSSKTQQISRRSSEGATR